MFLETTLVSIPNTSASVPPSTMSVDTELKEAKLVAQRIFYNEFCGTDIVVDSYDNDEVQRLLAVCVEAYSFIFSCSIHPRDSRGRSKNNPPYLTHKGVRSSFLDINKLKQVTTLQYIQDEDNFAKLQKEITDKDNVNFNYFLAFCAFGETQIKSVQMNFKRRRFTKREMEMLLYVYLNCGADLELLGKIMPYMGDGELEKAMNNFRSLSGTQTFKMRTNKLKVYLTSTVKVVWEKMISDYVEME